jgi:hypothetical protein
MGSRSPVHGSSTNSCWNQSPPAIQKETWHKTDAMFAEYVREGRLIDENASEGIGL